jgi:hypothetical protein
VQSKAGEIIGSSSSSIVLSCPGFFFIKLGVFFTSFCSQFKNDPQNCSVQVFLSVSHAGTCHLSIKFNMRFCLRCFFWAADFFLPAEELVMISIKV